MSNLLIIAKSFSTKNNVGGRRWGTYSKTLCDHRNVFLLCEEEPEDGDKFKKIEKFKSRYPEVLTKSHHSFIDKFFYKLAQFYLLLKVKGSIYDRCQLSIREIKQKAEEIIANSSIDIVLISGAPFSLFKVVELKKKFPSVTFILDYRDGWNWGHGYGYALLQGKRKLYEIESERTCIEFCDVVLFASKDLKVKFSEYYPEFIGKRSFVLINSMNLKVNESKKTLSEESILISHFGSVNLATEKYWKPFLLKVKKNSTVILNFYGIQSPAVGSFISEQNISNVFIQDRVNKEGVSKILAESHFALMFKRDDFPHSFPSKYFDYIASGTPIIGFGPNGDVKDEMNKEQIGIMLGTEDYNFNDIILGYSRFSNNFKTFNLNVYKPASLIDGLNKFLK